MRRSTNTPPETRYLGVLPVPGRELVIADPLEVKSPDAISVVVESESVHLFIRRTDAISEVFLGSRREIPPFPPDQHATLCVETGGFVIFSKQFLPAWQDHTTAKARQGTTYIDRKGTHWYCAIHGEPPPKFRGKPFGTFDDPIPDLGGLSMNELRKKRRVETNFYTINADEFSTEGAQIARLNPNLWSWLTLDGKRVAFAAAISTGDGRYPVYRTGTSDIAEAIRISDGDDFS